jgi:hypothetical protein
LRFGNPRPLREPCHDRQAQRRRQAGYGQIDVDPMVKAAAAKRIPVAAVGVLTQEGLEPAPIKADGTNNGVIANTLALIAVCDGHTITSCSRASIAAARPEAPPPRGTSTRWAT